MPYIVSIPISSEDYIKESKNLTKEQIQNIMFPEVISPLQQEFISWNYKLSHLHTKSIFRLANFGFLTSIFLYLEDDVPLRASITKGNKSGFISK